MQTMFLLSNRHPTLEKALGTHLVAKPSFVISVAPGISGYLAVASNDSAFLRGFWPLDSVSHPGHEWTMESPLVLA